MPTKTRTRPAKQRGDQTSKRKQMEAAVVSHIEASVVEVKKTSAGKGVEEIRRDLTVEIKRRLPMIFLPKAQVSQLAEEIVAGTR